MIKKRNKFLTICFSFIPGAGHMFMGFMKRGISLMILFFSIIIVSSWLDIGLLVVLLPVVWFYAFFDSTNRAYMSDEKFYQLEDTYPFNQNAITNLSELLNGKVRIYVGGLIIFIGVYLLWKNFLRALYIMLPYRIYEVFYRVSDNLPKFVFAVIIIFIGLKLITGKREELKKDVEES